MLITPPLVIGALSSGAPIQRAHKASARANRLAVLLRRPEVLSTPERKELSGLQREDTYDEGGFTPAHAQFKEAHNTIFVDLAKHLDDLDACCFYLDGPQGHTTTELVAAGFDRSLLFTANWHPTTCAALQAPPHGLIPSQVAQSCADEALCSNKGRGRLHLLHVLCPISWTSAARAV